jgi:protein decreased size exclusion limit 1
VLPRRKPTGRKAGCGRERVCRRQAACPVCWQERQCRPGLRGNSGRQMGSLTRTAASGARAKRPRPSPTTVLRGHTAAVSAAQFLATTDVTSAPTSKLLATGDADGHVHVWDTFQEETVLRLPSSCAVPSQSPILAIEQDPLSASLYVQSKAGVIRRVDLAHNPFAQDASPVVAGNVVACTAVDSFCGIRVIGPGLIAGPSGESDIVIRDARLGVDMPAVSGAKAGGSGRGMLMCIDVLGGGGGTGGFELAAGYEDGCVAMWDTRSLRAPVSSVSVSSDAVIALAGCPGGGGFVAVGSAVDDFAAVCKDRVVATGRLSEKGIGCVRWRRDGRVVATAGWDGRARLWDGRRKTNSLLRPLGTLQWHTDQVQCVSFSRESGVVATGGKDKNVAVWNVLPDRERNDV